MPQQNISDQAQQFTVLFRKKHLVLRKYFAVNFDKNIWEKTE